MEKLVRPSDADWKKHKNQLIDQYVNQGKKAPQLVEEMKKFGFKTTPRMIRSHMADWGIKLNLSSEAKESICRKVLEEYASGRPSSLLDIKQVKKLQRYCKEKPDQSDEDRTLLKIFKNLEISPPSSAADTSKSILPDGSDHLDDEDLWEWLGAELEDVPALQASPPFDSAEIFHEHPGEKPEAAVLGGPSATETSKQPSLVSLQPTFFNNKYTAMARLCNLSQQYYRIQLQGHMLQVNGSGPSALDTLSQNRVFWTEVKSGIYYLKMRSAANELLAWRELGEAFQQVPVLCERQPLSLLKDIHATLSPVNTSIRPVVRAQLIYAFQQHSLANFGPEHPFSQICQILCGEEGSDELSILALRTMLNETKHILPAQHPEIFEIARTLIRLRRRSRQFEDAETLALELAASAEKMHGADSVSARLALTEYVYILNDQRRYDEALLVAEDIHQRGLRGLKDAFPDEKAAYNMEDLAEICERLDRIDDCIGWLRQASRAALKLWGNHTSTEHVWDKLDAMQEKRYRQALAIQEK